MPTTEELKARARTAMLERLAAAGPRDTTTIGGAFAHAPEYELAVREGRTHVDPIEVRSADELRYRTLVTYPQMATQDGDTVVAPTVGGGNLFSLVRVVPDVGTRIPVGYGTSRSASLAGVSYETAFTEASIAFSEAEVSSKRFGRHFTCTKGVWTDRGNLQLAIDTVADGEFQRCLSDQILNATLGTDAMEGVKTKSGVASSAKSGTRFDALVAAASRIRGRGFTGPLTAVVAPTDATLLFNEKTSGEREYDADVAAALGLTIVNSSVAASGTAVVGSFYEGYAVYLRQGISVSASDEHASDFIDGSVTVAIDLRGDGRVTQPAAFELVTSF